MACIWARHFMHSTIQSDPLSICCFLILPGCHSEARQWLVLISHKSWILFTWLNVPYGHRWKSTFRVQRWRKITENSKKERRKTSEENFVLNCRHEPSITFHCFINELGFLRQRHQVHSLHPIRSVRDASLGEEMRQCKQWGAEKMRQSGITWLNSEGSSLQVIKIQATINSILSVRFRC